MKRRTRHKLVYIAVLIIILNLLLLSYGVFNYCRIYLHQTNWNMLMNTLLKAFEAMFSAKGITSRLPDRVHVTFMLYKQVPLIAVNIMFYALLSTSFIFLVIALFSRIETSAYSKYTSQSSAASNRYSSPATSYSDVSAYPDTGYFYTDYKSKDYTNQGASYYINYGDNQSGSGIHQYPDFVYHEYTRTNGSYSDSNYSESPSSCY